MRRHLLPAILVVLAGAYAVFVAVFALEPAAVVRTYGHPAEVPGPAQIRIYVEVIAIDPVNDSARMRLSFTPDRSLQARRLGTPAQDIVVRVGDGTTDQDVVLRAGQPIASHIFEADLNDGAIVDYPLDRFNARLNLAAFVEPQGAAPDAPAQPLTVNVLVWEAVSGWSVRTEAVGAGQAGPVTLAFRIERPVAVRFLVLSLYGVMAVFATIALAVSGSVALRRRRLEVGLGSVLSAMVFSLPALRYGLPGGPPLGVRADLLVYLWAQIGVALGLFLFLGTWLRGEPKP